MTRVSEVIRGWLGWCPNVRTMNTAPVIPANPAAEGNSVQPDGGAGRSGRIDRGKKFAVGSIKILIKNKNLLWLSLLTFIAMVFYVGDTLFLQLISGTNPFPGAPFVTSFPAVLIPKESLLWLILAFASGFIIIFVEYYLLAGLIAYASRISSGTPATIREGLSEAGNHIRPLAGWATITALISTAVLFISNGYTVFAAFLSVPEIIFFVLTMFVIPSIVLNNSDVVPAMRESVSVFRKTWVEIIVFIGIFFLMALGIWLISAILAGFGVYSGTLASVGAAVALFIAVLLFLGSILWAAGGIAAFGIYFYGVKGVLPSIFDGPKEVKAL